MNKNKILSIIILLAISVSFMCGLDILDSETNNVDASETVILDPLVGFGESSNIEITEINLEANNLEENQISPSIQQETFESAETIKTDHYFNNQTPQILDCYAGNTTDYDWESDIDDMAENYTWYKLDSTDRSRLFDNSFSFIRQNDSDEYDMYLKGSDLATKVVIYNQRSVFLEINMRVLTRHSGTFYVNALAKTQDEDHTADPNYVIINSDASFDTTEDYLDSEGYLYYRLQAKLTQIGQGGYDFAGFNITHKVFNTNTQEYDVIDFDVTGLQIAAELGDILYILGIQYAVFVPDVVESYPRAERLQTSPKTYNLKLKVDSFDYGTHIKIYAPTSITGESYEYVVDPVPSSFGYDASNNLWINNTVPTIYEITFQITTEDNYYAVYDISGSQLYDPSFEGTWQYDWANTSSDEWTVDLTSNTIFDGSLALNLTSPSSVSTYCSLDSYVYPANYLITFAYYRTTTDDIYLYWWDNDGWQYELLDNTTDRWIKHIGRYNITGDTAGYNIAFVTAETDQNIIIDDIRTWIPNGQVRTTGYANSYLETGMFATIRNIDLYNNPAVPYHPVTVQLRDRSIDESIFSYNTISNADGRIQVGIILPFSNQFEENEYTFRVISLITNEHIDSHFTPIKVNYYDYFMEENSTNYGIGGVDFTENWDDGATYYQATDYQINGLNRINPDSATRSDMRLELFDLNDIDSSYYNKLEVVLQTNVSDLYVAIYDQEGNLVSSAETLPERAGLVDWETITFDLSLDADWNNTENGTQLLFDEVGGDGLIESNNFVWIEQIWLYHEDTPVLVSTPTYLYMASTYGENVYYVEVDSQPQDYIFDYDPFILELSNGNHTVDIVPFLDLSRRYLCYIPADTQYYIYQVAESGTMKILIHDQSGYILPFDQFKVFIDDFRLYDQYVFYSNISQSVNLTITDLFDNIVYQNTSELFEYFKQIQITLYSVKVQNQQENPIWVQFRRGSKTFSEWVFPWEVIEYRLEIDTYYIRINYTNVASDFEVSVNGTSVEYSYYVDIDTALMVTGTSIQDVFENTIELATQLTNVNSSITNQIIDVEIYVGNVNTSISNQIINVDIVLNNVNTTIGTQLTSLSSQIINLNTNITLQITSLNSSIINMNSTIYSQTVLLLSDISNVNTTLYDQSVTILSEISNVNSTLYAQTVTILTEINNINSTLYDQGINILSNITYTNTNINNTRTEIMTAITYLNSTLWNQTMLHTVHFALADQAGIGLPWETFRVIVNGSRQYDTFIDDVLNGTVLSIEVTDYYNTSLYTGDYLITEEREIALFIPVYWVYFKNDGGYPALVTLERNGISSPEFTVPVDSMVLYRLTSGSYEIKVRYHEEEPEQDPTDPISSTSESTKIAFSGRMKVSARLPTLIDASTPKKPIIELVEEEYMNAQFVILVIGLIIGSLVTYMFINLFLRPTIGRHVKDIAYVKPEDRGSEDLLDKIRKKFRD